MSSVMYSKATRTVWAVVGIDADGWTTRLYETEADAKRAEKFGFRDRVTRYPITVFANSFEEDDPRLAVHPNGSTDA